MELSPSPTPWMAVRPEITLPDPAIIGARFIGTVMLMSVDRSWASTRGRNQRWGGQQGLVAGLLAVLTGLAGGLFGQASKRLRDFGRSYGPLRERVLRNRLAVGVIDRARRGQDVRLSRCAGRGQVDNNR